MAAKYIHSTDRNAADKYAATVGFRESETSYWGNSYHGFLAGIKYARRIATKQTKQKIKNLEKIAPVLQPAKAPVQKFTPDQLYEMTLDAFFDKFPHIIIGQKMPSAICFANDGMTAKKVNNRNKSEIIAGTGMVILNMETSKITFANGFSNVATKPQQRQLYFYPYEKIWGDVNADEFRSSNELYFFIRYAIGF